MVSARKTLQVLGTSWEAIVLYLELLGICRKELTTGIVPFSNYLTTNHLLMVLSNYQGPYD